MMAFHADGTLIQTNPDAARSSVSDSAGMGIWRAEVDQPATIRGRFVEVCVDRATGKFAGLTSVLLRLTVREDYFEGFAETSCDNPEMPQGPRRTMLSGTRVKL